MKTKKFLAGMLVAVMSLGAFAGCSSKTEVTPTPKQTQKEETKKEEPQKEEPKEEVQQPKAPVELTLWGSLQNEGELAKMQRERFLEENPEIKINLVDKAGDTNTEFAVAFAAGVAPDYTDMSGPMFKKYAKQGFFAPLDAYIETWEEKDHHIDAFKEEIAMYDGKNYGIVKFIGPMMFGYNKALFNEAGLTPPKTWEEMVDVGMKLTDRSKGQYGYSMLANDWLDWFFQFYVWQAGGDLTKENPDGTIELTFTSEPVVKAVEFYRDLKWNHDMVQSDITLSFDDMRKEFATGKSAMMIFAPDWVPQVASLGMKIEDLGIIPMPTGPSGELVTSTGVNLGAINAQSNKEEQDAAWKWLSYQIDREVLTEIMLDNEKKGIVSPQVMIYDDMKQSDIVTLDPAWEEALQVAADTGRDEYAGKAVLTKYIVAAIQKVLVDEKADIRAELQKQQDLAQKEAIDKYNQDILAGN